MRRLSLFLVLGLVIISLVGCGEMETVDDNAKIIDESSKQLNSLLVKSLAENASYLKEVVKNDNGNTYSIEDPQLWAEYYVSELAKPDFFNASVTRRCSRRNETRPAN